MRLSSSAVSCFLVAALAAVPLASFAAGPFATADFYGRRLQLEGTWTVETGTDAVAFVSPTNPAKVVRVKKIRKNDCTYLPIRTKGKALWGTEVADSKGLRLVTLVVGRSRYRGYKWAEPSGRITEQHWCLAQDNISAVEISAPLDDKKLVAAIDGNLLLQVATRRGVR